MPTIPALGRLKQEEPWAFKADLSCISFVCLQNGYPFRAGKDPETVSTLWVIVFEKRQQLRKIEGPEAGKKIAKSYMVMAEQQAV